jgi:hypothetical protein
MFKCSLPIQVPMQERSTTGTRIKKYCGSGIDRTVNRGRDHIREEFVKNITITEQYFRVMNKKMKLLGTEAKGRGYCQFP